MKAVIFDCDGMVNHEQRFSERLAAYVPLEKSLPFFKNEFQRCLIGKADLKEELAKKIREWGWQGSVDDVLTLWFSDDANELDEEIVTAIKKLRSKEIKCYLTTNNERYRTEYLTGHKDLAQLFDAIFPSYLVGAKKPEPAFYEYVFSKIPEYKQEVLYWDDDQGHISEAERMGIPSKFYTKEEFFRTMQSLL